MSIRGKKPKPRGDVLPDGDAAATSGVIPEAHLECPDHLDKFAREHWGYYAPLLWKRGLLTPLDVGPFTLVCEAWSIYRRCQSGLKRTLVMKTKTGYKQQLPQYNMMQQAWNSYSKLAEQFGLTPVSRGRLDPNGLIPGSGPGEEDDGLKAFVD